MSTATIRHTTWAGASAPQRQFRLRARPYWRPRPEKPFLAAELALLAAPLLYALRGEGSWGWAVVIASCIFSFHVNGLNQSIVSSSRRTFVFDLGKSVLLAMLVAAPLFFLLPGLFPGAEALLAGTLVPVSMVVLLRSLFRSLAARHKLGEGILIIGTGDGAAELHRALGSQPDSWQGNGNRTGTLLQFPQTPAERGLVDCDQLVRMTEQNGVKRVVIAEQDPMRRAELSAALLDCRVRGLRVSDAIDFYEELSGTIWVQGLYPQWLVYTGGFNRSKSVVRLKRCADVVFALLLTVLASPLLVLAAIAIKLDSRGPVLFRQIRVGRDGRTFVVYKFRSMCEDAENETGPMWAQEADCRVTRVGKVLRKIRLDELPQVFNVLRGEMSLVGPRPERPYFVDLLEREIPFYDLRHSVKPGITGWAQVSYPYGASVEAAREKLQYDLYYAKNMSLRLDALILLKTLRVVLFGKGR
jgi:sugar transferase (PEP-CTERM system associated)